MTKLAFAAPNEPFRSAHTVFANRSTSPTDRPVQQPDGGGEIVAETPGPQPPALLG